MKQQEIINGFVQLGQLMSALSEGQAWTGYDTGVTEEEYNSLNTQINKQVIYNGWFTPENVRQSIGGIAEWLKEEKLIDWASDYSFSQRPKKIAIIMAGNIPLVGFHDFLSVLMTGNTAICKLSSDDNKLLPLLGAQLINFVPELKERIVFSFGPLPSFDSVIATGSNNSMKYFEEYFGKYPHLFRKNRTSVAVLDGSETREELEALGEDVFNFFGLGCRNVSHLLIPEKFNLDRVFEGLYSHKDIVLHKKYGNNYDYHKAIYLLNKHELLDNNFILLRETEELHSPLAMLHYHRYKSVDEVESYIKANSEDIQAIIGRGYIPFGKAQSPDLIDYADGIDTMAWLSAQN